ncbi:MAG: DHA2 family efflux MFS transporter permease subunit [Gammaproteobacteria bacterium]
MSAAAKASGGIALHRGPITIAVMLAALMQVLDMTIANVAIPHMEGSFATNLDSIKWVLTSYIVASAIATPLMGWLAERYGRRNILLIAVASFSFFSFMVGSSTALAEIVLMRIFQGVAGAAFTPLAQAILLDTYPRERHGTAMAIFALGILVGPILGPTLGGYITEYYSWRWDFFINIPVGIVTFLMIWNFVPRRPHEATRPFDVIGFILLSIGIGALQYTLDRGSTKNWFASNEIVFAAAAAFVALWIYPWYATLKKNPFVSMRLFRDRNFSLGIILILMLGMVLLGTGTLLPPLMQQHLNYPVLTTGLVLAPRGLGAMIAALIVGRLITRINPRYLIVAGLLINSASLYMLSGATLQVTTFFFVSIGFLQGIGLGLTFVPLTTVTFSTLPANARNEGTPIYNLIRNIGSSIGISIVYTLLTRNTQINHAQLGEHLSAFSPTLAHFFHQIPMPRANALAFLNQELTHQAAIISYNNDFLLMAGLMLLMVPIALFMRYDFGSGEPPEAAQAAME